MIPTHQIHKIIYYPSPSNIKEENVKVKAEEDEASTDDEYTPEGLVSWLIGYDPVKSEETDDEELGEDTNTSNEQHLPIKVKAEVKTEDDDVSLRLPVLASLILACVRRFRRHTPVRVLTLANGPTGRTRS